MLSLAMRGCALYIHHCVVSLTQRDVTKRWSWFAGQPSCLDGLKLWHNVQTRITRSHRFLGCLRWRTEVAPGSVLAEWSAESSTRLSRALAFVNSRAVRLPARVSLLTAPNVAGQDPTFGIRLDFSDAHSPRQVSKDMCFAVSLTKRRRGMVVDIRDAEEDDSGSGSVVLG